MMLPYFIAVWRSCHLNKVRVEELFRYIVLSEDEILSFRSFNLVMWWWRLLKVLSVRCDEVVFETRIESVYWPYSSAERRCLCVVSFEVLIQRFPNSWIGSILWTSGRDTYIRIFLWYMLIIIYGAFSLLRSATWPTWYSYDLRDNLAIVYDVWDDLVTLQSTAGWRTVQGLFCQLTTYKVHNCNLVGPCGVTRKIS